MQGVGARALGRDPAHPHPARDLRDDRPGGQVRIQLHPGLAESFRSQQATIEKNVQRSVKIQSDPQLPWEDYRIVLE